MNKLLSLLAALALTAGAASCGSSDADEATDAGAPAAEVADDAASDDTESDSTESDESSTEMEETGDVDTATMLPIVGSLEADAGAFEAGNIVVVKVNDLTVVDPAAAVVSESTIEITDQTAPMPFEIVVDRAELDPTYLYGLRVIVTDADGTMLYTTNSANSFKAEDGTIDLGTVSLTAAS